MCPSAPARKVNAQRGELLGRPADPDPEEQSAPRDDIQAGRLFRHHQRVVLREQEYAGRHTDVRGHRGDVAQDHQRVEPIRIRGNGDTTVGGIGVGGVRTVHHHHVLSRPQRRETGGIGCSGHGFDDSGIGAGADPEGMESDPHGLDCPMPRPATRRRPVTCGTGPVGRTGADEGDRRRAAPTRDCPRPRPADPGSRRREPHHSGRPGGAEWPWPARGGDRDRRRPELP